MRHRLPSGSRPWPGGTGTTTRCARHCRTSEHFPPRPSWRSMKGPRPRRLSQGRYKELVDGVMPQPEGSLVSLSRPQWMRLLALAEWTDLEARSRDLAGQPHDVLRAPETGLVMLRGRMGATGAAFNLGEATVTRCAVRL